MKKLTFIFLILLFNRVIGQVPPLLTYTNNAWITGENSLSYSQDTTNVLPGVAGANITWDFSSLQINSNTPISLSMVSPSSTPYASQFSNATVASLVSGNYQFFKYTATSCEVHGLAMSGLIMQYTNPATFYTYPFTYQNSSTDNFTSNYTYMGYNFQRTGTVNTIADAWGSLIIGGKTFNNLLRIKMVQDVTDDASLYSVSSITTTYWWFDVINKTPVFEITIGESTNTMQPGLVTYNKRVMINSQVVVGIQESNKIKNVQIYPNPSNGNIYLNMCNLDKVEWFITDITGKLILKGVTSNSSIDCSNLNNGYYFLTLKNKDNFFVKKIVIQH